MGSKSYINDLLDMSDTSETSETLNCQSEISKFFTGYNILITGGSGFLGILLIEKLLRCCPDLGKLYIFMRAKKNKSADQRFKEHFDNVVYDRLKKEQPDFINKIILIEADCGELNLGLSPKNQELILDTNVIFHAAATVRFNQDIRTATNINIRGTKQLLLLAKEMPNFKAFVYISTAFSYCINKFIEEKFYPPPMETEKMLMLLDILDDENLKALLPTLIGKWPNTYAFTKALAEDTVRQYSIGIPTCIARPSIITSTSTEPVSGWINNIYGAVGVVAAAGLGVLHTLHCVSENVAEIVPVDYVISHIVTAGWDTAKRKDTLLQIDNANPNILETKRVPIYNYVSICQNPIQWKRFMKLNEMYGMQVPSMHIIWYYMFFLNRHLFVHKMCVLFLHMIPAFFVDTVLFLSGRKPMLLNTYKKINTFTTVISYFSTQQWQFRNDAVLELWNRMNPADQQIFNFNLDNLDWEEYLKNLIPGLRLYIVKDPMDTLEQAKIKYRKLKIAHYTLLTIILLLLMWGAVSLIIRIMSLF